MPKQTDSRKPLMASFVEAVTRGRFTITGADTAYFAPGQPLEPQAQEIKGRVLDYGVGVNINRAPRDNEPITYQHLRALADNYDLLRLAIETRKDQMEKLKWTIRPEDEKKKPDARCEELIKFFKNPDQETGWKSWLRMLMEDLFVIDAPTIYYRETIGGKPYALEVIDGATIKRLIDPMGRTPIAPQPAYQQIIKGMAAVDYTTDELVWRPHNRRSHKLFGYSPVEQVIMTVNIALRRQLHQLQYYTEGNIPEAMIGVPNNWNVDQIKQFQTHWDSLFENNTGSRRHAKFVPGDMKYQPTKESMLKDEYDEWLARVVCYAFSLPPLPFVKQVNRATAETAQEAALEEGLAPIMGWVEDTITFLIHKFWGYDDLVFSWKDEKAVDPLIKAQVDEIYIRNGVLEANEVRAELGKDPLPEPEEPEEIIPGSKPGQENAVTEDDKGNQKVNLDPPNAVTQQKDDTAKGDQNPALKKKALKKPAPIPRMRPATTAATRKLAGAFIKTFRKWRKQAVAALTEEYAKVAADTEKMEKADKVTRILNALPVEIIAEFMTPAKKQLTAAASAGAEDAAAQIGADEVDTDTIAAGIGNYNAAELVGKKYVNGKLVDNPNAKYRIDENTRELLRATINDALENGTTTDELADELEEAYAFSDTRARTIARTEVAKADMQGSMESYRESGVVEAKEWILSTNACPICEDNANDGIIPLDDKFSSGDDAAPAHPNCECSVIPVVKPLDDSED